MSPGILLAALLLAEPLAPLPRSPDLYVAVFFGASVERYYGPRSAVTGPHPAAGEPGATYAAAVARRPWGMAFGPDGNLYVANIGGSAPAIARVTGPFASGPRAVETFVSGGAFYDVAFGPDGNLYAAGRGAVRRYDRETGALIDAFTSGYELAETRGLAFGPDGRLYVSNYDGCVMADSGCTGSKGEIVRFDALTGAFVDVFVGPGEAGLRWPWKLAFGARGELFVVNWSESGNDILRFAPPFPSRASRLSRGIASAVFIRRADWFPLYLAAGPDGDLYVSASETAGGKSSILRFDGRTGAFAGTFIDGIEAGARGLAFR
jgi:glucose/arabinose dehydrogenase